MDSYPVAYCSLGEWCVRQVRSARLSIQYAFNSKCRGLSFHGDVPAPLLHGALVAQQGY